jgi:triosephosphate isomerase (TIM)
MSKIIVANWKMNLLRNEAISLVNDISKVKTDNTVVICPPFPYLSKVKKALSDTNFSLGAQDLSEFEVGAYTGEVGANMLKDMGADYVIIGHSERRNHFHETDEIVFRKILSAQKSRLISLVCVGENIKSYQENRTRNIVEKQLINLLNNEIQNNKILIAYEPQWSIGTGITPSPEEIYNALQIIKGFTNNNFKVLYGGSVNGENIEMLNKIEGLAGFLIGGAGLNASGFEKIIYSTR